jgi:hypothetical protein
VEGTNALCLWEAIVLAAVDEQLRGRPAVMHSVSKALVTSGNENYQFATKFDGENFSDKILLLFCQGAPPHSWLNWRKQCRLKVKGKFGTENTHEEKFVRRIAVVVGIEYLGSWLRKSLKSPAQAPLTPS